MVVSVVSDAYNFSDGLEMLNQSNSMFFDPQAIQIQRVFAIVVARLGKNQRFNQPWLVALRSQALQDD